MRKIVCGLWLLLLIASPFSGQTTEWKKYKNTDGNFTVLFPGDPQDSINQSTEGVRSHTLMAREGSSIYTVVYTVMDSAQTVDEHTYQVFRDAVFKELPKCEQGPEQPASPALEQYIGHHYRLSCAMPNEVTVAGNLYWGKHYAFAVMTMFPSSATEAVDQEKRFMDSFGAVDPAK